MSNNNIMVAITPHQNLLSYCLYYHLKTLKKVDSEEWRRNQVSLQICYIHGHCNNSAHFVILFPPFKDRLKWHGYFSSSSTLNFWPVRERVSQPYSLKDCFSLLPFLLSILSLISKLKRDWHQSALEELLDDVNWGPAARQIFVTKLSEWKVNK